MTTSGDEGSHPAIFQSQETQQVFNAAPELYELTKKLDIRTEELGPPILRGGDLSPQSIEEGRCPDLTPSKKSGDTVTFNFGLDNEKKHPNSERITSKVTAQAVVVAALNPLNADLEPEKPGIPHKGEVRIPLLYKNKGGDPVLVLARVEPEEWMDLYDAALAWKEKHPDENLFPPNVRPAAVEQESKTHLSIGELRKNIFDSKDFVADSRFDELRSSFPNALDLSLNQHLLNVFSNAGFNASLEARGITSGARAMSSAQNLRGRGVNLNEYDQERAIDSAVDVLGRVCEYLNKKLEPEEGQRQKLETAAKDYAEDFKSARQLAESPLWRVASDESKMSTYGKTGDRNEDLKSVTFQILNRFENKH